MKYTYSYTQGFIKNSPKSTKILLAIIISFLLVISTASLVSAGKPDSGTRVPGHARYDADNNKYPDAGQYVNGHYTSYYAEDGNGDYYWDLGDGRIYKTVDSVDDLDQESLTECNYVNNYRADFGNDPYMNTGWIQNHINCTGADSGQYNYLIVHADDPRYTGNSDNAIWGDWEYIVNTQTGSGNLAKVGPQSHME